PDAAGEGRHGVVDEVQGRGRVVAEVFRTRDQVPGGLGMEQGQPLVEPPLVKQSGLVVEELGDSRDESAIAQKYVSVAEICAVNARRCQPVGYHETTPQETASMDQSLPAQSPSSRCITASITTPYNTRPQAIRANRESIPQPRTPSAREPSA